MDTVYVFLNEQIRNCIYHFDRIRIAFVAFTEVSLLNKVSKKMVDGGSIQGINLKIFNFIILSYPLACFFFEICNLISEN